jgi:hypothetical protein
MTTKNTRRETFANDTPLITLATDNPWIDHFHVVEAVDGKDFVFHFDVWRDATGAVEEVVDEKRNNADNEVGGPGARVVGDEAHD